MNIFQRIKDRMYRHSWDDVEVGLIVSTGRTGTEFLAKFLSNNVDALLALHEPGPDLFDLGVHAIRSHWNVHETSKALRRARARIYRELINSGMTRYVESNNNLALILPSAFEVFPVCRVVHVVRDPRTYVVSAYSKLHGKERYSLFSDNDPRARIGADDFPDDHYSNLWSNMNRFSRICWHWRKYNEMICQACENQQHVLTLRFEDIFDVDKKFEGLYQLLEFLNIRSNFRLDPDEIAQAMSHKQNRSHGYHLDTYEAWPQDKKDQFLEIVGEMMHAFGYHLE